MGKQIYTMEQEEWIIKSINENVYERTTDFVCSFNEMFDDNKTWSKLKDKINRLGLSCTLAGQHEYTASEKKWIVENYNSYPSVEEVLIEFNKTFNSNKSIKSFRAMANTSLNLKRTVKTRHCDGYSDKQDKWLNYVCKNRIYSGLYEITTEFNKKFNTNKTIAAIQSQISRLGLYAKSTHYSDEEILWILENKDSDSWKELAEKFSKEFGRNITDTQLRHASASKGFYKVDPYKSNDVYKVGDEMISDNGHVYVKVANARETETKTTHPSREVFKPKGRLVWEEHYGEIPEGHQITFLDGDKTNCDISNLELIPITISGAMSKNGFWNIEDVELKKTAIMYCQLVNKMKQNQE